MQLCEICGNNFEYSVSTCPFCGHNSQRLSLRRKKPFVQKTVNLEQGLPFVDEAIRRLESVLAEAKVTGVTVLTVIHGYGSSGRGGRIKEEYRKILVYKRDRGEIRDSIPGELFKRRDSRTKSWLQRLPGLAANKNLDKGNRGITLIII